MGLKFAVDGNPPLGIPPHPRSRLVVDEGVATIDAAGGHDQGIFIRAGNRRKGPKGAPAS